MELLSVDFYDLVHELLAFILYQLERDVKLVIWHDAADSCEMELFRQVDISEISN